jgi:hypothetical protein
MYICLKKTVKEQVRIIKNMELIDKYSIYKDYPANRIMKITCSTHAMCVCVCEDSVPTRFDFYKYGKKQPNFLNERENQWKISQKSNLITY